MRPDIFNNVDAMLSEIHYDTHGLCREIIFFSDPSLIMGKGIWYTPIALSGDGSLLPLTAHPDAVYAPV
jgi:hypothetical protein